MPLVSPKSTALSVNFKSLNCSPASGQGARSMTLSAVTLGRPAEFWGIVGSRLISSRVGTPLLDCASVVLGSKTIAAAELNKLKTCRRFTKYPPHWSLQASMKSGNEISLDIFPSWTASEELILQTHSGRDPNGRLGSVSTPNAYQSDANTQNQ